MPSAPVTDITTLPALMTRADLQRFLGLSHYTTSKLIHRKDFPVLKIGGLYRIPKDDLLAWLDQQRLGE